MVAEQATIKDNDPHPEAERFSQTQRYIYSPSVLTDFASIQPLFPCNLYGWRPAQGLIENSVCCKVLLPGQQSAVSHTSAPCQQHWLGPTSKALIDYCCSRRSVCPMFWPTIFRMEVLAVACLVLEGDEGIIWISITRISTWGGQTDLHECSACGLVWWTCAVLQQ